MEVVGSYGTWQEVYSIDESFVGLVGVGAQLQSAGDDIRAAVMELNGTECIAHMQERADKQQIMFSRSFSTPVPEFGRWKRSWLFTHNEER